MENLSLIQIYEESYKNHSNDINKSFYELYEKAIDKQYATKFQLQIIDLINGFIIGSDLDQKIIQLYNHHVKLGANIHEIIDTITDYIIFYKKKQKKEDNKNELSVEWKRFLGIPYKLNKINLTVHRKVRSQFENLTEKNEIAKHLGKQIALIDIKNQIKIEYLKHGEELSENDIRNTFPTKYKSLSNLKESIEKNDLAEFFKILQSVFATLSYDMKITEGYFHSHIHLILKLLDFEIHSEVETNQGRIDSVIESKNYIHIFEFKQNSSEVAIEQILNKKYYEKYFLKDKEIILVGISVDKKIRNIIGWSMKTNT